MNLPEDIAIPKADLKKKKKNKNEKKEQDSKKKLWHFGDISKA